MATTTNKQRLLNQVLSSFPVEAGSEADPRPVLEQFVYGLCRENATPEQADCAYRTLCERFFDWNEVRVSSQRELEEVFEGMAHPEVRAQRLLSFLHEVFETTFSFCLDDLQKKKGGVKDASKQLMRYQAANDFVGAWVVQRSLGGHAIPLDPPALRCVRRLGIIDASQDDLDSVRATLEHLVPKAKGCQFTDTLSVLADECCFEDDPNCAACPLNGECATAQESGVVSVGGGRSHRTKPR
jgi:endonuclease III